MLGNATVRTTVTFAVPAPPTMAPALTPLGPPARGLPVPLSLRPLLPPSRPLLTGVTTPPGWARAGHFRPATAGRCASGGGGPRRRGGAR